MGAVAKKKQSALQNRLFFCHESFTSKHLEHLSFFATIFFECFQKNLEFTIHGGIKRAKTRMCTFQHFFHECKWHWHIGDVFLNILVSYLHFSDLVWISYEVFKLTVKRSKGKSIRGAKWLGQNRWLLGIRAKTDEWDTTRGINLIIPLFFALIDHTYLRRNFYCMHRWQLTWRILLNP